MILKNDLFLSWPFSIFFSKKEFFCLIFMKTSQSLLVSKDGSKFWCLSWFPAKNHSPQTFQPGVYEWKWRAALTEHGLSSQSANLWKIAKTALFYPCMIFESFWSQMTSFEEHLFMNFIHKVPLALSKWINVIISIPSERIFFLFSLLFLIYFF